MAKAIEQILGYVYLTGLVEQIKTGIPDVLPPEFKDIKTETIMDQGRYTRVAGTRQTSQRTEYGSPAKKTRLRDVGSFDVKLIHSFEHLDLDVKTYLSLRNYTDYNVQNLGMQELDRQALQFRIRADNHRLAAIYSMLANGAIYYDANGNLLPNSTGAFVTVSYNVPGSNFNQINLGAGNIIAATWVNASTDIPSQIRQLKKQVLQQTGFEITEAFYGTSVPGYVYNNTTLQPFLSRQQVLNMEFMESGEIPQGLLDLNWRPVYKSFFDAAQTDINPQSFFPDNMVVFTPPINKLMYELMEGTYPVPNTFQPVESLQASIGGFTPRKGIFQYAVPIHNPMTAQVFQGDTFLPIWKVPNCLFPATVGF